MKTNIKKLISSLLCMASLSAVLCGCGQSNSNVENPTSKVEDTTVSKTSTANENETFLEDGSKYNIDLMAEYNEEETSKVRGGFYCDFGAGIRYKALNFSLGLQHQVFGIGYEYMDNYDGYYCEEEKLSTKINSFYVKIGINF